jgi:hypothetical protein
VVNNDFKRHEPSPLLEELESDHWEGVTKEADLNNGKLTQQW